MTLCAAARSQSGCSGRRQLLDDLALLVNRSPGGELSARRRVLLLVSALPLVLFIGSTVTPCGTG